MEWALGVVGLEPDRLAVLGDRLVQLPLAARACAEIDVGRGVVGLEPDRLAVLGDGLVQLPLAHQGDAEVGVGRGVVGLEPDRLAQGLDGLLQRRIGSRRDRRDPSGGHPGSTSAGRRRGEAATRSWNTAIASSPRPRPSSAWASSWPVSGRRARAAV